MLGSAAVLIAPLDESAGSFCVPSKILAYLCAGRPTVMAIDRQNPAAATLERAGAGYVIRPGDSQGFIAAVEHVLNDDQVRLVLGRSARRYAESAFALDAIVPRFLNILQSSGIAVEAILPPSILLSSAAAHP